MEWLNWIIGTAVTLIGTLSGFVYYRQNRIAKELENEAKQSEEWRKLYEEMKAEAKERDTKIDSLYDTINQHRNEKAELRQQITDLSVKVTAMRFTKCEKLYCADRIPPTELTPKKSEI